MLKIGEFSTLTGISIHMLRNYDKIGLLKPETVESMNNYRFYGENQIVRANHIQVLKSLGFGLNEISKILIGNTPDDRIRTFLESKIRESSVYAMLSGNSAKRDYCGDDLTELAGQMESSLRMCNIVWQ